MTELKVTPLGTTGWTVTRVGLGSWAVGGGSWSFGWGPQDDADSLAAIRHAVEVGVNWIDTAAAYGLGHAEEVVGRALSDFSPEDRPLVFTKGGLRWDDARPMVRPRRVGERQSLRDEVEASLGRLGVERIDCYQMHWPPDDGTPIEDYWATLLELRDEGLVAACGLSNHAVEALERAEALGHVDVVQPPYSLVKRQAAADVIPWAKAHGAGVIVYSPMQAGLLSGSFSPERAASLLPDDWRRRDPEFEGARLSANLALADALEPVARRHRTTKAAVAVAWTTASAGVSGAIVGARRPAQVDGWIEAATLELAPADLDEIAAALSRTGAGSGPERPLG